MYFSAKLFSIQDDNVLYLEGKLFNEKGDYLWDEVTEYEDQLIEYLKGFKYTQKKVEKDENRYFTHS